MKTFTEWLSENYNFANTAPASKWKEIWFNLARNYLQKMRAEGEEDVVDSSVWRINQIAKKLDTLGDKPLTANDVTVLAASEEPFSDENRAHTFDELIDAIENVDLSK